MSQPSAASRILAFASSKVSPSEQHPGKAGISAQYTPDSSRYITAFKVIISFSLRRVLYQIPAKNTKRRALRKSPTPPIPLHFLHFYTANPPILQSPNPLPSLLCVTSGSSVTGGRSEKSGRSGISPVPPVSPVSPVPPVSLVSLVSLVPPVSPVPPYPHPLRRLMLATADVTSRRISSARVSSSARVCAPSSLL